MITNKLIIGKKSHLMHFADIIPSKQTFKDHYPIRDNGDKLLNDILDFVVQSQNHFSIRSGNVERWEVETKTWMEQNKEIID